MLEKNFDYFCNTRVSFGNNVRQRIIDVLLGEKWQRPGIVVDHNIFGLEAVNELINTIQSKYRALIIGKCLISEPTYDSLEEARGIFSGKNIDVVIGIGGGSALDMAKAIAVLVNNHRPAIEYRGFNKMDKPVLPIIAIPTTAGTGSEVTPNASFIDTKEKKKLGINGETIRPRYALLDPELTVTCPAKVTISSGVDSMVHAIEAYAARKTNPIARMYAREGFNYVFNNLLEAVKAPNNLECRKNVMLGAFLSGVALMNSGTGPAAAMSYPLGVHYRVPHGLGGGILLPFVVQYNIENGYFDYGEIIASDEQNLTIEAKAALFIERITSLWKALAILSDIRKFGFKEQDIPMFVKETMGLKGALDQNPVQFYEKQIESAFRKLSAQRDD